ALLCTPTREKDTDTLSILVAAATMVLSLLVVFQSSLKKLDFSLIQLPWLPSSGKVFGFLIDPLSAYMLLIVTLIGFLVVFYSAEYLSPKNRDHATADGKGRYSFWLFLFIGSMIGVVTSPNLLQLFIFWELTSVCSWALISFYGSERSVHAGYKALLITHLGGLFFMVALVIQYVHTHSFSFDSLNRLPGDLKTVTFILLLVAAWAKAAQIPFYTWLPDAMEAPTPISAYLHAAAMVKAGVYLAARISISTFDLSLGLGVLVAVMALATMLIAVFLFFFQDDLKRLLALSTIAHLAYILLGVGLGLLGSRTGLTGGLLHIMCHAFAKALLFLSVGAVAYSTGVKSIKELSGLSSRMPLVSVGFFVGILSVTGVPPFSCFWSKYFLLTGAIGLGGLAGALILIPFILEIIVAFAWFLRVGQNVFFGEVSEKARIAKDPPFLMSATLVILMIFCVIAPLIALPIVHMVM
ncbi:MAG: hydrogenase 4 subunit D, partial [candidate division NC10 bacterium]|nr:hydrogenase 4 subunit D [candidate division NC10 bacterium]